MNRVLIDTNILIYAIDEDSVFFSSAQTLLSDPETEYYTTSKNLSEFLAVATRGKNPPLSIDQALVVVEDIFSSFIILYPSEESYHLFMTLLKKYHITGLQVHDCEIASIAIANNLDLLATFNTKDFEFIDEIKIHHV